MDIDKIPKWILPIEIEDETFPKNFVLKSESLKEIANLYEVSRPTVRLRLDKLIQKIKISDQQEDETFQTCLGSYSSTYSSYCYLCILFLSR